VTVYQHLTVNRHQNATMVEVEEMEEEVRMSSTASAAVRLSVHCEKLDDGNGRNHMGNILLGNRYRQTRGRS
jgi:molybdenum cofactor biosynthesis enzyme